MVWFNPWRDRCCQFMLPPLSPLSWLRIYEEEKGTKTDEIFSLLFRQYQTELDRMMTLRRSNLSSFINAEREALTQLYDQLYLSHSERIARFPSLTISVDPERVWRDDSAGGGGGYEEEIVNENVSEELLIRHEREREKVEVEVEDARVVLERLERYFEVVQKGKDLEAAAADPTRLTARGSSTKLLLEERDRKRVAKEKPKVRFNVSFLAILCDLYWQNPFRLIQLEAELRSLIPEWESKHRRLFTVDGVPFLDSLDEQQRIEDMEKENKRVSSLRSSSIASFRGFDQSFSISYTAYETRHFSEQQYNKTFESSTYRHHHNCSSFETTNDWNFYQIKHFFHEFFKPPSTSS